MIAQVDNPSKPTRGQKTARQFQLFGGMAFGAGIAPPGMMLGPNGSIGESPLGALGIFPWWGGLLSGTYATYRAMLRHPVISYVFNQISAAISASTWTVDADADAPKDAVQWVTDNILAHRDQIVPHALRALVFGNSPFEIVWRGGGQQWTIDQFVPLLPDWTEVLRGDNGNGPVVGYENGQAKLGLSECLYIRNTADLMGDEPGWDYGRARTENIRDTSWAGWLDTWRQLAELEMRVSGILPLFLTPEGQAGNGKSYAQNITDQLPAFCHPRSQGLVVEKPSVAEVDAGIDPKRYAQLTTEFQPINMGDRAAAQGQMLAKLEYCDKLIARGLMRGERAVFESKMGTRADAGQHSQNAEPDFETIDNMIADAVNANPVRTGLILHWGPDVLKAVRGIKPAPLVDKEREAAVQLVEDLVTNTATGPLMLKVIDGVKVLGLAGIPVMPGVDWQKLLDDADTQKTAATASLQNQPGKRPPEKTEPDQKPAT